MPFKLRSPSKSALTPRAARIAKWIAYAWSGIAIAFGIAMAIIGALEWDRAANSVGWPTVRGTVIESRVEHSTRTRKGRTTHTYTPRVRYRYGVDGREFEGDRVWFRSSSTSEAAAARTVATYASGSEVTVHHAPDDPGLACLEPGVGEMQWLPVAGGAAAMLTGLALGWFVPRMLEARLREAGRAASAESAAAPRAQNGTNTPTCPP